MISLWTCYLCSGKILSVQLDIWVGNLGKNKAEDINLGVVSVKIFMGLDEII